MSDPKRATIITVGAPKSVKNNVNKTVRLTINLEESNELKCPELNYKELVIAAARKKRVENGKTAGLDPFSDNDDDVERVARKFEQKYGGKSTYGRKGRSKYEDFADIGAGYDENDSFIDNTHGYDEMIPPECDTLHGGFYINSGSLEFKTVPENQVAHSDGEQRRNNKRRISSSSSEEDSSESSSDSDSQDVKDTKPMTNGNVDSHKTEHRKKKNKKNDKKKAKKVGRTDSSAATSGKQTSDENGAGEGESADSRTSQSDSLTSKPAPSSENVVTSDSSRDTESKVEVKLPQLVSQAIEELEALGQQLKDNPGKEFDAKTDLCVVKLERSLNKCGADNRLRRVCWGRAAAALRCSRARLLQRAKRLDAPAAHAAHAAPAAPSTQAAAQPQTNPTQTSTANSSTVITNTNSSSLKRKANDDLENIDDVSRLTPEEKEARIVETLQRLQVLIDERKPDMIATYNAECERVQQERKKMQIASAEGAPHADKRLPKRRFPWCARSRALLARLARLAAAPERAAALLATRALPLFPPGFVRMPTLLRQANLNKEVKAATLKRQRIGSTSQSQPPTVVNNIQQFNEPIQFPSSLTVTTTTKTIEKEDDKHKTLSYGSILNTFSLNKDLIIENPNDRTDKKDVPNNLGSITITPVLSKEKKVDKKEPLIRVKSPAALNNMVKKDGDKKRKEKKDKIDTPLHIDTNTQVRESMKSPRVHEFSKTQIDSMKAMENNIPHPALVPVHHSPTFAKPDKRPPEKKKKDIEIVSDLDPLGDIQQDTVAVDDSSSDIEVIEDKVSDKVCESDTVPSDRSDCKVNSVKKNDLDDATKEEINTVMRGLEEMKHSQSPTKVNCNSYGGVITSAKHESSKQAYNRTIFEPANKDKLLNF
ncbi:yemanuclein-like isoform X2 [Zerene cesonia]|uniref:yemanuclein-like isoform X2 n=1 Tax=Zerene cesonia TaxID=33412 RepID=UPI0018E52B6A|nr:yemanuclein-like isoform X2 [Zerene cesonia]